MIHLSRCALFLTASIVFAAGCTSASGGADDTARVEARPTITAEDIAALPPGGALVILESASAHYSFDASHGPIDFDRIRVERADGSETPMNGWLSSVRGDPSPLPETTSESFELSWENGGSVVKRGPDAMSCRCCFVDDDSMMCFTVKCGTRCGDPNNQ